MPDQKYSIEITVKEDGSVVLKQLGQEADSAGKKAKAAMDEAGTSMKTFGQKADTAIAWFKQNWLAASVAIYGAMRLIHEGMAYIDLGAKAIQAEESFKTVARSAGESADAIIEAMKRAAAGTIDDSALLQKAVKGIAQGLSGPEIVKLTEGARVAARVAGIDIGEAFDRILDAVANQMPRGLRSLGLITAQQMKSFSESVGEGEGQAKLLAIVLENIANRQSQFGTMTSNASEKVQKYNATIKEVKETIGKDLVISLGAAIDWLGRFGQKLEETNDLKLTIADINYRGQVRPGELKQIEQEIAQIEARWKTAGVTGSELLSKMDSELAKLYRERASILQYQRALQEKQKTPEYYWGVDLAGGIDTGMTAKELELQKKLQGEIKALSADNFAYRRVALAQEIEEERKAAGTRKENIDLVNDHERLGLKKIADDEKKFGKDRQSRLEAEWKGVAQTVGQGFSGLPDDIKKYLEISEEEMKPFYRQMGLDMSEAMAFISPQMAKEQDQAKEHLDWILSLIPQEIIKSIEEARSAWEISLDHDLVAAGQSSASQLTDAFGSIFFDAMHLNFTNLGSYINIWALEVQRNLANVLGKQLTQILLGDYTSAWGGYGQGDKGLLGSLISGAAKLLGLGGESATALWTKTGGYSATVPIGHSGGTIGLSGFTTRQVPASVFFNAPRLHGGLAPDEFPFIGQRGETILPRGTKLEPRFSVNIVNNAGPSVEVTASQPRIDAEGYILNVFIDAAANDRKGFKGALRGALSV